MTQSSEFGSPTSDKGGAGETKVVRGQKEVENLGYLFLDRANLSFLLAVADDRLSANTERAIQFIEAMFQKNPSFRFQLITDLQSHNLDYYKKVMEKGVQIRHIEGNKIGFAVSEGQYIATPLNAMEDLIEHSSETPSEVVWSTNLDVVSQAEQIFRVMWKSAVPAELRIQELEQGVEYSKIQVMTDPREIQDRFLKIISGAQREILIMLPTVNAFHREETIGVIDLLEKKSNEVENFSIRLLSPFDQQINQRIKSRNWQVEEKDKIAGLGAPAGRPGSSFLRSPIEVHEIESPDADVTATMVVVDKKKSLVIEQKDDSQSSFSLAIGLATYSNSKPTVNSYLAIFQKLWREAYLREKEEKSRKQSELLQDILTHDIRNYNQVARMGTEVLVEEVKDKKDLEVIANTILQAIDGSTQLVEKAKKLGRIIAEGKRDLYPADLLESIDRSLLLVKGSHPTKEIKETRKVFFDTSSSEQIQVMADDLLDDIFVNLFSNSVKFTQGLMVPIDISVREVTLSESGGRATFWQVTIADYGPGISSRDKDAIFQRYSKGQRGSGLGLSIVHTLVSERYGGSIRVHNRDQGPTGAIFDIFLKKG